MTLLGKAQTGTGKTLAFLTSTFHYLLTHPAKEGHEKESTSCTDYGANARN